MIEMYEYGKLTAEERRQLIEERRARGFPPHSPPHPCQDARHYFLTATCYQHCDHMKETARRRQVLDLLFEQTIMRGIEIRAWVILTNHYHILVFVPDFDELGEMFRRVHGPTARWWNREDDMPGRKVWYRFADRAMRSRRHYNATLNYIHYNPVKHRFVASPYDWEESSLEWYLEDRGRAWLRKLWVDYPIYDYGEGWDE